MIGVPQLSTVTGKSAALAAWADAISVSAITRFFIAGSQYRVHAQRGTSKIRSDFPVCGCATVKLVSPNMG
ncbi:hypothetical protein CWI88_09515 [Enterobacter cancerogenus]|nr:hypothetical protein CWI88_09515 [Enterobacter cancerogenus]